MGREFLDKKIADSEIFALYNGETRLEILINEKREFIYTFNRIWGEIESRAH